MKSECILPEKTLRFTILYDNYKFKAGARADWGFSCLIEGTEKTILFDTGTSPRILERNADVLNVDLSKIDLVVISHLHGDHAGGRSAVLKRNPGVPVLTPEPTFPKFLGLFPIHPMGNVRSVDKPMEICRGVFLTGGMGGAIKEQSLVIDSPRGLIVVTGCAHPGILNVIRKAKEIMDKPIHMVFGGFHLKNESEAVIKDIISEFRKMKIVKCGPTHCTGDRAIALFAKEYGENHLGMGTGRVIEVTSSPGQE